MGRYLDRVIPLLMPDQDIVIYCTGPECDDSELLARELYAIGFTNIMVYKGGYEEWIDTGLAVEEGL